MVATAQIMYQHAQGQKQTQAASIIGYAAVCEVVFEMLRKHNIETAAVNVMSFGGAFPYNP